jgi:NADPH:quinone reductase-like Zn-dependent oxidoreductase
MTTMKALRIHDYGGPEVLRYEDVPRPSPAADELLIRVHAVGVNPVDWKLRSGQARKHLELPMPAILGGDISGIIEQTGSAVDGFKPGDAVFAMLGLTGAYAQYIVAKATIVAPKPKTIDHIEAASVPLAALTAWQGLFEHGKLQRGQTVLVQAAAGGVGGFAVQFAKVAGARVIGIASAANAEFVRSLGATQTIDYRSVRFEEQVSDVDLVLDLIGGETAERSVGVLKPGGVLVQIVPGTPAVPQKAAAAKVGAIAVRVHPDGGQLREIAALIDSGKVKTSIAAVFPLAEAGRAQEMSKEGHTRGKIVLKIEA